MYFPQINKTKTIFSDIKKSKEKYLYKRIVEREDYFLKMQIRFEISLRNILGIERRVPRKLTVFCVKY